MSNPCKLSGVILAQNNESTIAACIAQLATICDEVVITDGGSTDRTVEIAAAQPKARVVHRKFDGNFPAQRNFSLDAARGEWTLTLDTDELLGLKALRWIPRLIRIPGVNWYSIPRLWLVENQGRIRYLASKPYYRGRQPRLLKNRPHIRYQDSGSALTHERLNRETTGYGRPLRFIHMFHYDFLINPREKREAKVARYMALEPEMSNVHRNYLWEDLNPTISDLPEPLPGDLRQPASVFQLLEQHNLGL